MLGNFVRFLTSTLCVTARFSDGNCVWSDNDDDDVVDTGVDAGKNDMQRKIDELEEELRKLRTPSPKKYYKWGEEHVKIIADVDPIVDQIKDFDINRLWWTQQYITKFQKELLGDDKVAKAAFKAYKKWMYDSDTKRNAGFEIRQNEQEEEEEEVD